MQFDRQKWNKRYRLGTGPGTRPEPFLLRNLVKLKKGSVLDLAAGQGRNSLFLAAEGFDVTAVDISDVGLQNLRDKAKAQNLSIKTKELDLDRPHDLLSLGKFSNIIIVRFKPEVELLKVLPDILEKDGLCLCCSFNSKQQLITKGNPAHYYKPKEFCAVSPNLVLEDYSSFEESGNFLDSYIFRNKP